MRIWLIALSLMVAVVLATTASAAEKKRGDKKDRPSVEERFKKMDTDNNGNVSQAEFIKAHSRMSEDQAKELYKKMGGTEDKGLTLEQFKKAAKEWQGKKKGEHKKHEDKK